MTDSHRDQDQDQDQDKDKDSDEGIEAAAERIFRNLSESRRGGGTEAEDMPFDPNKDDQEVPSHSSISEGLNATSADPVLDEDEDDDGGQGGGEGNSGDTSR